MVQSIGKLYRLTCIYHLHKLYNSDIVQISRSIPFCQNGQHTEERLVLLSETTTGGKPENRRLLDCIIGDELERQSAVLMKEYCNGCIIDHPSQMQHECVITGPEDPWYECIYDKALIDLDLSFVYDVFLEVDTTSGCSPD